jgi:glycine/D-amino acid oxidase-like deaminating enzyme
LRSLLLGLAQRYGVQVEPAGVDRISADPLSVRLRDGQDHRADRVVVAAGAWSPGLLAGLERAGPGRHTLITKLIQYTRFETDAPPGLPAFVDETTGLYGRPDQNGLLLGLPTTGWRVDPQQLEADAGLVTRVADVAQLRLGLRCPLRDQPNTTVVGVDCYTEPTGLALRPVVPDCGIYSFTGGSGGSAKIVLAASRRAAAALTDTREEET